MLGECPLCFLPLSLDANKSSLSSCCSELVCVGCSCFYHLEHGRKACAFCREPVVNSNEKHEKRAMKRVKANDPVALSKMGRIRYQEGDYEGAFKYLSKAAELGDADAHYRLGFMYWKGQFVEKDAEKEVYHLEKAAIGGHPTARNNLAYCEERNGNMERAVKHLIIAANLGLKESMKALWGYYSDGYITKEDLDATLRAHQAAIDATKSSQRDVAEAFHQQLSAQILYRGGRVGQEERR
jgi:TPR repeat protein